MDRRPFSALVARLWSRGIDGRTAAERALAALQDRIIGAGGSLSPLAGGALSTGRAAFPPPNAATPQIG